MSMRHLITRTTAHQRLHSSSRFQLVAGCRYESTKRYVPTVQEGIDAAKEGQSKAKLEKPEYVPKFLDRPLGVTSKPSSDPKSQQQAMGELLDKKRHVKEREKIVKQISRGLYYDFHRVVKDHGGKLWVAPDTLIREDKALYFPNISGKTVADGIRGNDAHTADILPGKISLVAIKNNIIAEDHVKSYKDAALKAFDENPNFQFVQINMQESRMKYILLAIFIDRIKRDLPVKQHSTYIVTRDEMMNYAEAINTINKYVGYVYLVDTEGKIRWAACSYSAGDPETGSGELESMVRCIDVLLNRLEKPKKNSSNKKKKESS